MNYPSPYKCRCLAFFMSETDNDTVPYEICVVWSYLKPLVKAIGQVYTVVPGQLRDPFHSELLYVNAPT